MAVLTASDLASDDAINDEIWATSRAIQQEIQPARRTWARGEVGAQQAMCGAEALPWVPDLVGADFGKPGSILFVGMAYAGFIRRAGHPRGQLPADLYGTHRSSRAFCQSFVASVVPAYAYYTHALRALPALAERQRVAFTDLCRVALVKIGVQGDTSSGMERADRPLFCRYADHASNREWHLRRLAQTNPLLVVALGHVAEHGVLRLLRDHLQNTVTTSGRDRIQFTRRSGLEAWPTAYACMERQIATWAQTGDWWRAEGLRGRWNVVTVPHTSEEPIDEAHVGRIRRAWEELQQ